MATKRPPKIRIWHSRFLQKIVDVYAKEKGLKVLPPGQIKRKVTLYKKEWRKYEKKILKGMSDFLSLEFYPNVINIHIVSGYTSGFSSPVTITTKYTPDKFVDILTHELIHNILIDNTLKLDLKKIKKKMFPKIRQEKTLDHILVHAVHKHIYLDVLKEPRRLKRDVERCARIAPDYKRAWDIVEERGYKEIIKEFKQYYRKIGFRQKNNQ